MLFVYSRFIDVPELLSELKLFPLRTFLRTFIANAFTINA